MIFMVPAAVIPIRHPCHARLYGCNAIQRRVYWRQVVGV